MNRNLVYSTALLSICIMQATDQDTTQKTVTHVTQHLETLQSMYSQLESIETDLDRYQVENAPTRDLCSTMSFGRETVSVMLESTQGYLSSVKGYLGTLINYVTSLTSNRPEPLHNCCCPDQQS